MHDFREHNFWSSFKLSIKIFSWGSTAWIPEYDSIGIEHGHDNRYDSLLQINYFSLR